MARTEILKVCLTPDEFDEIETRALAVGMPNSTFVRAAVLAMEPPKPRVSNMDVAAVTALNRVGSVLNQIARHQHIEKNLSPRAIELLKDSYRRLMRIVTKIEGDQQDVR